MQLTQPAGTVPQERGTVAPPILTEETKLPDKTEDRSSKGASAANTKKTAGDTKDSQSMSEDDKIYFVYFSEINEQVQELMTGPQAEPERALEFLKQLEDFTKKIEKARKKTKN